MPPEAKTTREEEGGAPSPLSERDYQALGAFRKAMRQFLAFSEDGARAHGITSQQHQALLAIRTHEGPRPITIGELADDLLIRNHSAVGLVARMVERELIARAEAEEDRRRVVLHLLPRGEAILEQISIRNLGQLRRAEAILSNILRTVRRLDERGTWTARR